ncbi:MAG: sugar phosphate isomerase/epimerase family protein, partial [Bacteroidales bacterium]
MISRRDSLKLIGAAAASAVLTHSSCSRLPVRENSRFRYCLNTSTIRGQEPGLVGAIEIAAEAGYDGVELWVNEIKDYLNKGNSLSELYRIIQANNLVVEGAIGFAPWIVDDEQERHLGFRQMEEEMNLMSELGCRRIAAPPAGYNNIPGLDYQEAGLRYRQLLDLGRKTGVMPHLEFWGASRSLYNLGQALLVAASANDPDVRLLGDVYHLFRGGSGFNGLNLLRGNIIELFHMNDYPGDIPREEQNDADRVFPGDGAAPMKSIIAQLDEMGGTKILSLELFNREYWKMDALAVASEGLQKMKQMVGAPGYQVNHS